MNSQKVREQEIREEVRELLMKIVSAHTLKNTKVNFGMRGPSGDPRYRQWLRLAGPFGGRRSPKYSRELQAVVDILRAHTTGAEFADDDLQTMHAILNKRITKVWKSLADEGNYIVAEGPRIRFVAEALLLYMQHSAENSLSGPLAICSNCDGLFLIQRSGQKACSDKCRFEEWRRKDPDYWKHRHAKPRKKR
jgi:hypothetical protein